jgi:hypothetical protein
LEIVGEVCFEGAVVEPFVICEGDDEEVLGLEFLRGLLLRDKAILV